MLWEAQFGDFVNGAQIADRPVHRRRPLEVGPDVAADAAAAARVRGERPRALERAPRALPAARGAGEHPHRQPDDRRAVVPPAPAPGARPVRAAARRDDAQGPAAPPRGDELARGAERRRVPPGDRRRRRRSRDGPPARPLHGQALLRHRRPRGTCCCEPMSRSRASSSSTRSPPTKRPSSCAATARCEEIVWAQEEPQNMGAWRAIRHRLEDAASVAGVPVRFVGRPWRASPSEGYPTAHLREQDRIVREALSVLATRRAAAPVRERRRGGPRRLLARRVHDLPPLLGRQTPPDLERGEREADRTRAANARHADILARGRGSETVTRRRGGVGCGRRAARAPARRAGARPSAAGSAARERGSAAVRKAGSAWRPASPDRARSAVGRAWAGLAPGAPCSTRADPARERPRPSSPGSLQACSVPLRWPVAPPGPAARGSRPRAHRSPP